MDVDSQNTCENTYDITLAADTLAFIGCFADEEIPASLASQVPGLIGNLCDFQNRFARPMELPFQLGNDFETNLEAPKPANVLLKYRVAFPLDDAPATETLELEDKFRSGGKTYALKGGKTWKEMVAAQKLTGVDAAPLEITSFDWLTPLFELLEIAANFYLERKNQARLLAACWYHVATQLDFSAQKQDEQEPEYDPTPLLESLAINVSTSMSEFVTNPDLLPEDEESDSDYVPSESMEEESSGEGSSGEESGEEPKDQEQPKDQEVPDEDDDCPDLIMGEEERPPTQLEISTRDVIFRVVKKLEAWMPNPETHMPWFKRVLKHIRTAQAEGDARWYPWGCPPMVPLIETLKGSDPFAKQIAGAIILLFQQQVQEQQANTAN